MSWIEIVPSTRPTIITLEVPDEEVLLAFDTSGKSLRERVLLALFKIACFRRSGLGGGARIMRNFDGPPRALAWAGALS